MYEMRKKLNQDAELPRPFSGMASSATVPTSLSVPMSRRSIREAWPKSSRPTLQRPIPQRFAVLQSLLQRFVILQRTPNLTINVIPQF
jgi:hypothetical protein